MAARYASRSGKPIVVGSPIQISHCVGRYGQMQNDEGIVVSFDDAYRGVVIRLLKRSRVVSREGYVSYLEPGQERYLSLPIENPSEQPMRCVKEHKDFEHGHVAYVELIEA